MPSRCFIDVAEIDDDEGPPTALSASTVVRARIIVASASPLTVTAKVWSVVRTVSAAVTVPHERADGGDQLIEGERLAEEGVGAGAGGGGLVAGVAAGTDDDHTTGPPVGAEVPAHLHAARVGHHHVEHDGVDLASEHGPQRLVAGVADDALVAGELQGADGEAGELRVVVDDQHAATNGTLLGWWGKHGGSVHARP